MDLSTKYFLLQQIILYYLIKYTRNNILSAKIMPNYKEQLR